MIEFVSDGCCASASTPQDLAQIFVFGLLMSAGHCVGMCGPLVCAASVPQADKGASLSLPLYHAGRIASYSCLGAALGWLGTWMPGGVQALLWQGTLSLLAAAATLWVALGLLGVFPQQKFAHSGALARHLTQALGGIAHSHGGVRRFGLGFANGLLPCGPVYTIAVAAIAAGGSTRGALAMAVYGLGTVPVLVTLALGIRWFAPQLRWRLYRAGAALAVLMGMQLGLRGMAALDWVPHARLGELVLW